MSSIVPLYSIGLDIAVVVVTTSTAKSKMEDGRHLEIS